MKKAILLGFFFGFLAIGSLTAYGRIAQATHTCYSARASHHLVYSLPRCIIADTINGEDY